MESVVPHHPQAPVIGRVRWFDDQQQCGILAGVSGAAYFFERTGAEQDLPPVGRGEIVTFSHARPDQPSRLATDVFPLPAFAAPESGPVSEPEPEPGRSRRFARSAPAAARTR